jgi:hypothetical protein
MEKHYCSIIDFDEEKERLEETEFYKLWNEIHDSYKNKMNYLKKNYNKTYDNIIAMNIHNNNLNFFLEYLKNRTDVFSKKFFFKLSSDKTKKRKFGEVSDGKQKRKSIVKKKDKIRKRKSIVKKKDKIGKIYKTPKL